MEKSDSPYPIKLPGNGAVVMAERNLESSLKNDSPNFNPSAVIKVESPVDSQKVCDATPVSSFSPRALYRHMDSLVTQLRVQQNASLHAEREDSPADILDQLQRSSSQSAADHLVGIPVGGHHGNQDTANVVGWDYTMPNLSSKPENKASVVSSVSSSALSMDPLQTGDISQFDMYNRMKLELAMSGMSAGSMDLSKRDKKESLDVEEKSLNLSVNKPVFPGPSYPGGGASSLGSVAMADNEDVMDAANLIMALRDQEMIFSESTMASPSLALGNGSLTQPKKTAHTRETPYKHPFYDYRWAFSPKFEAHTGTSTSDPCKPYKHDKYPSTLDNQSPTTPKVASPTKPTKSHMNLLEDKPFMCSICNFRSAHKFCLESHMNIHREDKPFQCPLCDSRFNHGDQLDTHLRNHGSDKPYKCPLCDYSTAHKYNLDCHMKAHESMKMPSAASADAMAKMHHSHTSPRSRQNKPHECSYCDSRFAQKTSLARHMRTHTGEKPHECSYCEKRFSEKANLVTHLRTHTGEKPYTCPFCDYKSAQHTPLSKHMKTHSRDKP